MHPRFPRVLPLPRRLGNSAASITRLLGVSRSTLGTCVPELSGRR